MQAIIEQYWPERTQLTPDNTPKALKSALLSLYDALTHGDIRVSQSIQGDWQTNAWIKQGILLSFRAFPNQNLSAGNLSFFDKVPVQSHWEKKQVRVVPPAVIRSGAHVAPNCVVMPSFINVGAYVGQGSMIDTWATVGSCAQIGERVHLSGGAGIGGVLEPLQATPTIIENDCFIGARSEIVEGVIVRTGAVISMGVFIGQSTPIYDRTTGKTIWGEVPANAVVVPGTRPSKTGDYALSAAIIVKYADLKTRKKVGLNALLRDSTECL